MVTPPTSKHRVATHRSRLRRLGLRPVQLWLPDVRSASFKAEARRQSLLISATGSEADDQAFIDSISDPGRL